MPTPDQSIVLRIFAGLGAADGRFVPVTTLLLNWAPALGNAAFADAVEGLASDGRLRANAAATAYALVMPADGAF